MKNLREKFVSNYRKGDLKSNNILLKDCFKDYFCANNYVVQNPASLISREDKSVMFTSSSTNALKPTILSGNYSGQGLVLTQECLRTQALKDAFNNEVLPFGQAYFKIVEVSRFYG